MFTSVINNPTGADLTFEQLLMCLGASLGLGLIVAAVYCLGGRASKPLAVSLMILPAVVQIVIMMVNGNVGAGMAVMGAFSLIRFRSVPGSARDISFIFLSMAIGLSTAMGYLGLAAVVTVIVCLVLFILDRLPIHLTANKEKLLRVVMPEDLDYAGVFDDIFKKYTKSCEIDMVKTTNLGSMFEVRYIIVLKDEKQEKAMIDEIRCRNGNLTIVCARYAPPKDQL